MLAGAQRKAREELARAQALAARALQFGHAQGNGGGGDLVSVWQRNEELWTARSMDSGTTWSAEAQLAECCRRQPASSLSIAQRAGNSSSCAR